ncbi:MAG: tetratricopeptide repeat protein [Pirellulales bacterium]|nr:tetratricopeptide repeat protein [Pirellulales bacterium]
MAGRWLRTWAASCGIAVFLISNYCHAQVAATTRAEPAHGEAPPAQQERIDQLIRELGSPRYGARRAAAAELRQIGAEAFDSLYAATEDVDPEISASANYLLRQINVRWVQPDDPPTVRSFLRSYGQEPESTRQAVVEEIAKLPRGEGQVALCRIARFDRSPLISRTAALGILRPRGIGKTPIVPDTAALETQLGHSTRVATRWIRQYLAQLEDPAASVARWKQLIEEEEARIEKSGETSSDILLYLEWNLADIHRQLRDDRATAATLDRMMGLSESEADQSVIAVLDWLTEYQLWGVLDSFLGKHQSRFEHRKRVLYHTALAREKQGQTKLADELATRAAQAAPSLSHEAISAAIDLERKNKHEWAIREYRGSIERLASAPINEDVIIARVQLARLLHDDDRDAEASEAIEPLVRAVLGKGNTANLYNNIQEQYERVGIDIPSPEVLAGRYHFYRACQYQRDQDYRRAQDEYELAVKFDSSDADLLIAMFHFPKADDAWRSKVRIHLTRLVQQLQQQIDDNPADPTPYNQWAWLVSNTEGDFQKAIRYSRRSLELNDVGETGEASYLDTLARCYYAVGDYEQAVKYERQAIEKLDYMRVMHRQLAIFEKALAEKKAKEGRGVRSE